MLGTPAPADQVPTAAPAGGAPAASTQAPALTARLIVEADNQEFDLSGKDNIIIGREDAVSNIYPDVDLTPHGGEEGEENRGQPVADGHRRIRDLPEIVVESKSEFAFSTSSTSKRLAEDHQKYLENSEHSCIDIPCVFRWNPVLR